ncbi:hypothetical protein MRX96_041587 [Rhipicephalus microplus]
MTAPGPSSMDTSPQRDFQPILDWRFGMNGQHRRRNFNRRDAGRHRRLGGDHPAWKEDLGQRRNSASSFCANTRRKKARRSSVNESDEEEDLNMDNDADETASVSSISTQLSRTTEGQEGLNCGARFKKIYNRLNRQDRRINEISQKVDNVASAMTKFEATLKARITTGFEEMKLFMVQLLKRRAELPRPRARTSNAGAAQGVCTFVRKGLTLIKLDHFLRHSPRAVHSRGRDQKEDTGIRLPEAEEAEFELLSDPQQPSRIGTSITRDTTPDHVFAHLPDDRPVSWRNTGHNLGSHHYIIEVEIPLKIRSKLPPTRKHKLTDWNAFRQQEIAPTIKDLEEWTRSLVDTAERASTEIETDDTTSPMDPKLAHLIEARQSLQRRWKTNASQQDAAKAHRPPRQGNRKVQSTALRAAVARHLQRGGRPHQPHVETATTPARRDAE